MKTITLKKEDYPDEWPFIIPSVKIENPRKTKELYVVVRFTKYNFNGIAKKGLPLDQIWLENPDIPGTKKSIGFIFAICKGNGF